MKSVKFFCIGNGGTKLIHQSSVDNTYIMHTKIKEFIDVHFRRFDEINIEINQNSVSTFIDFHKAQLEFIQIRGEVEKIKGFLDISFNQISSNERELYLLFYDTIKNFLTLINMDIAMASKLDAKARACGKYGFFEYRKDSKERNQQSNATRILAQRLIEENAKAIKAMFRQEVSSEKATPSKNKDTILFAREIINEAGKESSGWQETIDTFNQIISELIEEENIHRKTDLLLEGLDNFSELFAEAKSMPNVKNSAANLNVIVHLRLFLDCVLAIDNDIITVNEIYTISKVTGGIRSDTHNFVKLMVKISDLLDRAIVYLFENLNTDSKDYYPILETKIRGYINEYVDDNTGWNKI